MQQENFSQVDPARLQAQKEYREAKDLFKSTIKIKALQQSEYRKFMSEKQGQAQAQSLHAIGGFDLRCMYIAYAMFRRMYGGYTKFPESGMLIKREDNVITDIVQADNARRVSPKYINELIQKHAPKTVYTG